MSPGEDFDGRGGGMTNRKTFAQPIDELLAEIERLDDTVGAGALEETAVRLAGLNYSPPVITPLNTFLRLNNNRLRAEIDRILAMSEAQACALAEGDAGKCDELKLQYITVLIFYYKKLLELRKGDPEAWDEIDELYVHD